VFPIAVAQSPSDDNFHVMVRHIDDSNSAQSDSPRGSIGAKSDVYDCLVEVAICCSYLLPEVARVVKRDAEY